MPKKSRWSKYLPRIKELVSENFSRTPVSIARQINKERKLLLNKREIDLFRMYISRYRTNQDLEPAKKENHSIDTDNKSSWDENKDNAAWSYEGTTCIINLDQAIAFSGVDMTKWEVERHTFNSWDVTMKIHNVPIKKTNYQVKVWFRLKQELNIARPEFRNIIIKPKTYTQMWVVAGCIHRPFHDKILWDKFLGFLKYNKQNITGFILDGDYLDLRSLSSHEDWIPDGIDLAMEYSDGLQGIHEIENELNPDIEKIYIYGNHEDRFFRDKKSIRKYGTSLPAPHEALELDKRNWQIITDWKNGYVTLGNNLDIFHGTKIGVNAAKDQLLALPNRDHLFFHTHRFGSFSNKTNTAYNAGCMIDVDHEAFKYVDRGTRQAWTQGFAVVYIDNKNNTHVRPIKVSDRQFFFEGIIY